MFELRKVVGWLVVGGLVLYVVKNPTVAAHTVKSWATGIGTFLGTLAS